MNIIESGDRTKGHKQIYFLIEVLWVEGCTKEHLSGALRMANVGELLLACLIQDVVNERGQIFLTKVFLVKVPVLFF